MISINKNIQSEILMTTMEELVLIQWFYLS